LNEERVKRLQEEILSRQAEVLRIKSEIEDSKKRKSSAEKDLNIAMESSAKKQRDICGEKEDVPR
jgi:predicted  nucleic acid-binding Zn-ribbon protein